jgi:seryl-tRNA synthetase
LLIGHGSNAYLTANYELSQIRTRINDVQKQIGAKKKAKEDANDLLKRKAELEKEMDECDKLVKEKELQLQKKLKTIGNIVHDSVPVENNEVSGWVYDFEWKMEN